jgi:two-component system, OmpR family, phosphate regulon sensor histidine kinase PhoR
VDRVWGRYLLVLSLVAAGAAILWVAAGPAPALGAALLALLAMATSHVRHLALLRRWLRHPEPETIPDAAGAWGSVYAALYRMVRGQLQSQEQLSASLDEFQRAGAAIPDGLILLRGADERIVWCNPAAAAHFGLDIEHDAGRSITYLVRQPQFAEYLRAEPYGEPLTLRPSRGADLLLSVQLVPYGEGQKLMISRDVTQLEQVETMRRDFIANVSHELRTPLTVIGGFLESLGEAERPDEALLRRALPLMTDQTRRMQRLVEDLLTLSRLESVNNPLREERVEVPRLVRALYEDALALSGGRHRVSLRIDVELGVQGNEEELRSAFSNLISNAVRYTPEGGEVRLTWERHDGGVRFVVSDTGIGIAREHIPRLTERFYRVDRSRSRQSGGTGLGLAIVKHVLSRHRARLEISSVAGEGSTFVAVFPTDRVCAIEPAASAAGPA